MQIIKTTNLNQARKQVQKLKKENKEIIVQAQGDEFNRKIVENKDVDVIIGLELHGRKDYLKQRDSGLNEILCKLAKKNNIKIGIDLDKVIKLEKKEKAKVLARLIQNIKLCKRTKTDIIVFPRGKYDKRNLMSLFLSLKGATWQGKKSV